MTNYQAAEWDEKWAKLKNCWDNQEVAALLTNEAHKELDQLNQLLSNALENFNFSLDTCKDTSPFPEPKPTPLPRPSMPTYLKIPNEPLNSQIQQKKPRAIWNLLGLNIKSLIASIMRLISKQKNLRRYMQIG